MNNKNHRIGQRLVWYTRISRNLQGLGFIWARCNAFLQFEFRIGSYALVLKWYTKEEVRR